jgi:arylsulfatase A
MHLVAEERTIANMLRDAGYDTGLFGKWHCNGVFNKPEQPQPDHHGFDYWFATQNNAAPSHENPTNFVRNGQAVGPQIGFSCQIVAKEASQWISNREDRSKPFFSFVCFHEPHEPVASPEDLVERYSLVAKNRDEAQYFANVENMDAAIGDLMRTLEQLEIADNTLVFFTSDNGPETLNRYKTANRSYGTPGSLRGMKLWVYEGGIRVPGIAHWPKGIAPGQIIHEPVCSVDLLPTLATLSGARLETNRSLDGTDLAGLLTSSAKVERQTPLYWFYYRAYPQPKAALRDGDWMVLGHWDGPHLGPGGSVQQGDVDLIKKHNLAKFELYNVREDPSQSHDLANSEPQLLQRMARMLSDKYIEIRSETRQWTE